MGIVTTLHPEGSFNDIQVPAKRRTLVRPEISYWKTSLNVLVPLSVCLGMCLWDVRIAFFVICIYVFVRLRGMAIWCVRIYQRYAPDEMRLACVSEPSCSEYMILSIEKYGLVRGIIRGVRRLKRCGHPNGGVDYP
jgi:putative component of membrane protein insertase Oxa1/YidC/SpoIIIJ protein YidD